jgi:O-antigen/teichoic acid export membrane protein
MSKNKSISYILIWQTIGKFLLQGIGFFTVPIFTRLLTTSDYGFISVYNSWISLCSLFIGFQTYSSIANAKIKFDDDKINGYLSSIMTISILSFIVVFLFVLLTNRLLASWLGLRPDLIILIVIQSFASFCVSFCINKFVQYKQVEYNIILSLLISISSVFLSLFFIYQSGGNKYIVKIYANSIPTILSGIVIIIFIYRKGKVLYNKEYWRYCLGLTLPLIFHEAGSVVLSQSDRIMLQKMVGESTAGIYSLVYNLALVISLIWISFNTTWIPFYYEYKKNNQKDTIRLRAKNYMVTFSIIVMGFILLAPEVFKIMTPEPYWTGIPLIPLVVLAYYFNFLYSFPINFEFYNEKTKLISIGTICAALINIACNFFLIPRYHGLGAAITTLIAFAFLFIFHEINARLILKNYDYQIKMYFTGLIPVIFTVILFYLLKDMWYVRWIIGFFLGLYLLSRIIKNKAIF